MDVCDKVVVITGAARGIGQEFARSLAAAGAHIVAADINDCSATLGLVEAQGAKAIGVTLDVRDAISAVGMATAATRAFGHIDALINNAALYGALRGGRFDAIAEADWDAAMAVNVKGFGTAAKRQCRRCVAQGAAASSTSPRSPRPTACPSLFITRRPKRP